MSAAALGTKGKASTPIPTGVPPTGRRLASAARLTPQDPEAARTVVFSIIARIESYLDEETAALSKSLEFDFKSSNDRKNQGLLDLNQAMRRLQRSDVNSDLQMRLVAFREKLAVNLRRIQLHLDAVREIAAMLSEAIQSAESDGTYTRNIGPYGNLP
jgi:hypothetical protein